MPIYLHKNKKAAKEFLKGIDKAIEEIDRQKYEELKMQIKTEPDKVLAYLTAKGYAVAASRGLEESKKTMVRKVSLYKKADGKKAALSATRGYDSEEEVFAAMGVDYTASGQHEKKKKADVEPYRSMEVKACYLTGHAKPSGLETGHLDGMSSRSVSPQAYAGGVFGEERKKELKKLRRIIQEKTISFGGVSKEEEAYRNIEPCEFAEVEKYEPEIKEEFISFGSVETAEAEENAEHFLPHKEEKPYKLPYDEEEKFETMKVSGKSMEDLLLERLHPLFVEGGAKYHVEVRPERCPHPGFADEFPKITLENSLLIYDKERDEIKFDSGLFKAYLDYKNLDPSLASIHIRDVMIDPKTKNREVFSLTTGEERKTGSLILSMARALDSFSKSGHKIIVLHPTSYEKYMNLDGSFSLWGENSEDGKREAVYNAGKTIKYLKQNWKNENGENLKVKLAIETGPGFQQNKIGEEYNIIYEPWHLKSLISGNEDWVGLCVDLAHANLTDFSLPHYIGQNILVVHVSGNDGKKDMHAPMSRDTLKDYDSAKSLLKFYKGDLCIELTQGKMDARKFLLKYRNMIQDIFISEKTAEDYENLRKSEELVRENYGEGIHPNFTEKEELENLERFKKGEFYPTSPGGMFR